MICKKYKRRDILNLFKEYSCNNCSMFLSDEVIIIGKNSLKIFYLINECSFNKHDYIDSSKRVNIIFKDIYIDNNYYPRSNNIFLWLDKYDDFHNYYLELKFFLNNNYNLYIII